MAMAAALLLLLLAAPATYAVQHVVGGSSGWTNSGDYATWAAGEKFNVGDTLLFNYDSSHSVDQVNQNDYDNCATGNALQSYNGGQTTITLKSPGSIYFICPSFGHCGGGMKLSVNVVAASTPVGGGTPVATPSPPSSSTSSGSPPSTTTTPANKVTPASQTGAASGFASLNSLVVGLFSTIVVAFMA
ncbi:unnamed protein product [Ilex paraguariensis]|uniref:Phytocyanin domain-containing protein n=1 Tax=Ilex paraguariensis TaxID=185542 RepID=A0ABC8RX22_9AQUA